MSELVQVQLGEYRGPCLFRVDGVQCNKKDYVIVEVEKGSEFGKVISICEEKDLGKKDRVKGKVLRKATEGDLKQIANNRMKSKDALNTCTIKVVDRKIQMQLVNAEYTFDSSKIIFSFTADGRIDFRSLVKDLARMFRVRIELKQIGVRDKAKVINGYGVCGRELCCSSYMRSFHPLSIKMAKEQGLPLNPSRISGVCGRIKCCMSYEFSVYKEHARGLPRIGEKITVEEGKGKIIGINILKQIVTIDCGDGKIVRKQLTPRSTQKTPNVENKSSKAEGESVEKKQG